ncbi:MAG: DoxX family protein [Propionicimonas sp.]|uniref:DoxX family protein n=1 Tax=Propionicimonas sp. TaxID=1955623 RepID=UPI003D0E4317
MNIVLWILQSVLALVFLAAGALKVSQPREKLQQAMGWVADFSTPMVRFIGSVEILAALGLVLPAATGILPILTPLAATGLVIVMIGAAVTHARRKEPQMIAANAVLLVLAAVVAWARFGPYAF